jgi:membrane protein required for colicin V production
VSTLDWILAAALLLSVLLGAWRGLVYEVFSVAGWVAAFIAAQLYAGLAAAQLPLGGLSDSLRYACGFALVFIATAFAAGLVSWLVKKLIESVGLRPVDRTLGAAFGLLRGVVILLAVTVVVGMTPLKATALWQESVGAGVLSALLKGLMPVLPDELKKAIS